MTQPTTAPHVFREYVGRLIQREIWWAEFWSCVGTLAWGILLFSYGSTVSDYPSVQVMLEMGPMQLWAFVNVCLGLLQGAALFLNRKELRWGACLLLCWLWGVVTAAVWAAIPPLAVPFGVLCGMNLYSVLRLPFKILRP